MHIDSDQNAVDLVSSIHVLLSERDDHVLDEPALRRELSSLLNNVDVAVDMVESQAYVPYIKRRSSSPALWIRPENPWVVQLA